MNPAGAPLISPKICSDKRSHSPHALRCRRCHPCSAASTNGAVRLAQPADVSGDRVDTLLRVFPNKGLTPEQADAVLGVMGEAELRHALRPRLLVGPAGAKPAAAEAVPLAAYARRIDAVASALPGTGGNRRCLCPAQRAGCPPTSARLGLSLLFLFTLGFQAQTLEIFETLAISMSYVVHPARSLPPYRHDLLGCIVDADGQAAKNIRRSTL